MSLIKFSWSNINLYCSRDAGLRQCKHLRWREKCVQRGREALSRHPLPLPSMTRNRIAIIKAIYSTNNWLQTEGSLLIFSTFWSFLRPLKPLAFLPFKVDNRSCQPLSFLLSPFCGLFSSLRTKASISSSSNWPPLFLSRPSFSDLQCCQIFLDKMRQNVFKNAENASSAKRRQKLRFCVKFLGLKWPLF